MRPRELRLLAKLRENSRRSLTQLAIRVKMPLSSAFKIVLKLEREVITKYTALLDFARIGFPIKLGVFVSTHDRKKVSEYLSGCPYLNTLLRLSGDYDFYAELVFSEMCLCQDFLDDFMNNKDVRETMVHFLTDIRQEEFLTRHEAEEEEEEAQREFPDELEKDVAIQILDEFEELLERKNVSIPSDDREGSKEEARLYGKEYYDLEEAIIRILNRNNKLRTEEGMFPVTSVCKDDIIAAFHDDDSLARVKEVVAELAESDMQYLASKLGNDYCDQLFWTSLKIIFEDRFLHEPEEEEEECVHEMACGYETHVEPDGLYLIFTCSKCRDEIKLYYEFVNQYNITKGKEEASLFEREEEVDPKDCCILCHNPFVIGENGNELGFCSECQTGDDFPYDLDAYYKDLDNGKAVFKGFETMERGLLEPYRRESKLDRKINDGIEEEEELQGALVFTCPRCGKQQEYYHQDADVIVCGCEEKTYHDYMVEMREKKLGKDGLLRGMVRLAFEYLRKGEIEVFTNIISHVSDVRYAWHFGIVQEEITKQFKQCGVR
jgi:DNA-binding Lrp family transcriptional regulator/DNA-directed RNA polymerase subunit M/transcription elongation factor TFIIS